MARAELSGVLRSELATESCHFRATSWLANIVKLARRRLKALTRSSSRAVRSLLFSSSFCCCACARRTLEGRGINPALPGRRALLRYEKGTQLQRIKAS